MCAQVYSPNDSLALLAIDAACDVSNNLNWNSELDPINWNGVTWSSGIPRRVSRLEIDGKSLTGVLDVTLFDSLSYLECKDNELDSLVLTNLSRLTDLLCSSNDLTSLSITTLTGLIYIETDNNYVLSHIDISDTNNQNLEYLFCGGNNLSELNLSGLTNLRFLDLSYGNSFDSLSFPGNDLLELLGCQEVGLQHLDISNLTLLKALYCGANYLTELNLDNQSQLMELVCAVNFLSELDISATSTIWFLSCSYNQLTELDVSGQLILSTLDCMYNQLVQLKLGNYTEIPFEYLDCSNNQLSELDLSGIEELMSCRVKNNKLPFSSLITGVHASSFTYSPQKTLYESWWSAGNTTLDYSSEAMINGTPTEFVFYKDGEGAETNTSGYYTTTGPGVYHCEMTNALFPGLTLTTAPVTIVPLVVEEEVVKDMEIYPNPVTDILHIRLPQDEDISQIGIYSTDGIELRFFENISSPVEIDMRNFRPGMYILEVITSETNFREQIIKW
jgi:Leucine-rich repeat (LRR) protein